MLILPFQLGFKDGTLSKGAGIYTWSVGFIPKGARICVAWLIDMGMKSDDSLGWFFYEGKSSAGISIAPPKFNIAIQK